MNDLDGLEFCDELYVVEKTVEVVVTMKGESRGVRIDALCNPRNGRYKTRGYIEEHVDLQATYGGPRTIQALVWTYHPLPWVDRETADQAIHQTLRFLKESCDPE